MAHAVLIATREGLEALTIGRVAESAAIAKSSVLGHYGSKEQLQLATLEAGTQQFVLSVIAPSSALPVGIVRLNALLERWVEQVSVADGGCLFASVAAEFDSRPGAVRDRVRKLVEMWQAALTAEVVQAKQQKHLTAKTCPEQLVFCLYGVELSLNMRVQLFDDPGAVERARAALRALLLNAATPHGKRLLAARRRKAR